MNKEELEILRVKIKNKIIKTLIIAGVIGIILSIITLNPFMIIIALVFGFVIAWIINSSSIKKFNLEFKEVFVKSALEKIFTNLEYYPNEGLDRNVLAELKMIDMGDKYSSNDYIKGKYKNIEVEAADVEIEEIEYDTDSDGHTTTNYVTIFKGKWMIFDFNKNFKSNVQVCQKGFSNSKINVLFGEDKFKRVKFEDADFNDKFRVYAQNEEEAFYVLTPSLMQKIKDVTSSINGYIVLCFVNKKLHVGIDNNKDSFEHGIFKPINEEDINNTITNDIKQITKFVDELNLDNDLFRKD